jgi:hypothetical protein
VNFVIFRYSEPYKISGSKMCIKICRYLEVGNGILKIECSVSLSLVGISLIRNPFAVG